MSRRKLERDLALEKGLSRLAAIKSISPTLDLGNDITAVKYEDAINSLKSKIAEYNTTLSSLDKLHNEYVTLRDKLRDFNERILLGVATKFGKNSTEYEMAGGVKKSERKRPTIKPKG